MRDLIDFTQPVTVLLLAVLHFIPDDDQPYEIVAHLLDDTAPGSFLAVSHITAEGVSAERSLAAQKVYSSASAPAVPRSREQILGFFDRLEFVRPGLVDINLWPVPSIGPSAPLTFYGGVARKD